MQGDAITEWFQRAGSCGVHSADAITLQHLESNLITAHRHARWLHECRHIYMCPDDGTQSGNERAWSIMREKKLWWLHHFGTPMPE